MPRLLTDLPPFVFGTTRLGHPDVPRGRQRALARSAVRSGLWLHTSRQYDHALEVLGEVFAEQGNAAPPLVVKLGGGTPADVRRTLAENTGPLGVDHVTIGQLTPVGELAHDLTTDGPGLAGLRAVKDEGLVGRFVLEIFPWTSAAPLAALRAGHLEGLVDGFLTYLNPLQRFARNELWDELQARDAAVIALRTVAGGPVHRLRDVPGAAWRPYLADRAAQVAPLFERSGVPGWTEFCFRYVRSLPSVVSTVGAASRQEQLDELVAASRGTETLPADVLGEIDALQRRWSEEFDARAEPWTL